jgi:hypothetical protein
MGQYAMTDLEEYKRYIQINFHPKTLNIVNEALRLRDLEVAKIEENSKSLKAQYLDMERQRGVVMEQSKKKEKELLQEISTRDIIIATHKEEIEKLLKKIKALRGEA